MSADGAQTRFNPRAMLVALQRREVDFILIGGLARVARGADEITRDLDICPSRQPINLGRLQAALIDIGVVSSEVIGGPPLQHVYDEVRLRAVEVVSLPTVVGELTSSRHPPASRVATTRFAPARPASISAVGCASRSPRSPT